MTNDLWSSRNPKAGSKEALAEKEIPKIVAS
jgi:hypothetical protein